MNTIPIIVCKIIADRISVSPYNIDVVHVKVVCAETKMY